ncbi:Hypothetical protein RG1141_PB01490 (plasmid) [Neorhizobium galegae bv. officinalis bv. officinalis str. HAMBI 1141]|uniref:Uncharacterized protein n=1 Tax=Neorhizobium galegae bv. officinalis bv. officinalis str. HAMBI 1141 TaxID=1028801 RepID=A0A068TJ83_NEOGA|nr:Hypothetical protein RG1141_PB01490 [Neorhizobium galegae bv. officinalis bv. officinalis str. HAMBI 1141]
MMLEPDLKAMRHAIALNDGADEVEEELLAWIIFRYYKRGPKDPEHLAGIANFLASSNIFNSPPARAKVAADACHGASPGV